MESTAPATTCASCGRPLGPTAAGAFCLSCLLSPAKNWLDQTAGHASTLSSLEDWEPGDKIDRYQLEELLGEGGFGIVYRAVQVEPIHREVALKVLKPRMASRDIVARFEGERQALAMMDHPNIARVYDAGATFSGCPYFVMELVKGKPITEFCRHLPLEDRLRLFIQACRGVQHAHQKGIIHRDIKPSNVLVMGEGIISVAKVIDFGIAKALEQPLAEKTIYTAQGQVMGTLQYMSPEQALSAGVDVDTRSDVYSLGVLLYEILTGVTPLPAHRASGNDLAEILKAVRDETPLRPSQELDKAYKTARAQPNPVVDIDEEAVSTATVRGDLDWIVMKALEKERARRYPSVSALMEDLERFLKQEPIQAKAPTARYRVARFARRNTIMLRFVGALAVVLGASTAILLWLTLRATIAESETREALDSEAVARQEAARQAGETRRQLVRLNVVTGDEMVEDGDAFGALLWYVEALRLEANDPAKQILQRQRYFCALQSGPRLEQIWPDAVSGEFSPDGASIAVLDSAGTAQIWSRDRLTPSGPPLSVPGGLRWVRFTDDPATLLGLSRQGALCEWDLRTRKLTASNPLTAPAPGSAPASPVWDLTDDGKWLAVAAKEGPQLLRTTPRAAAGPVLEGGISATQVRVSADGRRLAATGDWGVRVWDARTGRLILSAGDLEGPVGRLALNSDGSRLATVSGRQGNTLDVWDVDLGARMRPSSRPGGALLDCRFSPEGRRLAIASHDSYARVYDVASGLPLTESMRHAGSVAEIRFCGGGRRVATVATGEMTARVWDGATGLPASPWISHPTNLPYTRISADGISVMTGGSEGGLRLWRSPTAGASRVTSDHGSRILSATHGAAGDIYMSSGADGRIRIWNRGSGKPLSVIQPPVPAVDAVLSNDENWLLTGAGNGVVQLWDSRTGKAALPEMRHGPRGVVQVQFSPTGQCFFSLDELGSLKFWDRQTGRELPRQLDAAGRLTHVTYDCGGTRLLAADADNFVGVWPAEGGPPLGEKVRLNKAVDQIAFSTEGRHLLTASLGTYSNARVWDASSHKPFGPTLSLPRSFFASLSPDGKTVVTCGADNTAKIWDAATGSRRGQSMMHNGYVFRSAFSPDGRMVATCSDDGTARVWDAHTGAPISPPLPQGSAVISWNRESSELLTASTSGVISLWNVSPAAGPLDELQSEAELLAGRKIDSFLGTTALTRDELAVRWQKRSRRLMGTPDRAAVSRR